VSAINALGIDGLAVGPIRAAATLGRDLVMMMLNRSRSAFRANERKARAVPC